MPTRLYKTHSSDCRLSISGLLALPTTPMPIFLLPRGCQRTKSTSSVFGGRETSPRPTMAGLRTSIKSGDVSMGSTVTIEWGRQSRMWTAVVVDLLDQPTPTPSPAKRQRLCGDHVYCTVGLMHILVCTSIMHPSYTCATEQPMAGLPPPRPVSTSTPPSLEIGEFCLGHC